MTDMTPEPNIQGGEITVDPELTEDQKLVEWTRALAEVDRELAKERAQFAHVNENLRQWQDEQVRQLHLVEQYERIRDDSRREVQALLARVVVQSDSSADAAETPVVK